MAPIILKVKEGDSTCLPPFTTSEDLSKTWRVCTKIKDNLENGSRLENLSWRLWFAHNVNRPSNYKLENIDFKAEKKKKQEQREKEFTLQQFTSDQHHEVIELDDIFNSISSYLDPTEEKELDLLINESWPIRDNALYVSNNEEDNNINMIPINTLHNKLLATLPKETLQSANRLLYEDNHHHHHTNQYIPQQQQQQAMTTPNTRIHNYRFFHEQPSYQHQYYNNNNSTNTNYQQSKSLPPSRATSPPPQQQPPALPSYPSSASTSSSTSSTSSSIKLAETPPKQRINTSPSEGKAPICSNCSTQSTPLWRRSASDELLCNACGLYLKLHNAPRPKYLKPQSSRKDQKGEDENIVQPLCSNCGTSTTPLWRRNELGAPLCNACGLYLKLHHEKRPLSMKTDNIKKRQRCDNSTNKSNTLTTKKKNRQDGEPLTTTVTFDTPSTNYQYMDTSPEEYSPFTTFGLTLTNK